MLDQLGTLSGGDQQPRRRDVPSGFANGVLHAVVAAVGQRGINLAQQRGAALVSTADHNAIGIEKIRDRGALTQKLRIRNHAERARRRAVQFHDPADTLAGGHWDRALFDQYFEICRFGSNDGSDFAGHRLHVRKIGLTALGRRRAHGDKDHLAVAQRLGQVAGKAQPAAAMTLQQIRQKLLIDRDFSALQSRHPIGVIINARDLMAQFGETGCRNQANIARANDRNLEHCK